jgi:hypothetical protein
MAERFLYRKHFARVMTPGAPSRAGGRNHGEGIEHPNMSR